MIIRRFDMSATELSRQHDMMENNNSRIPHSVTFFGVEDPEHLLRWDPRAPPTDRRGDRNKAHADQLTQLSISEDKNGEDTFYAVSDKVVPE